jgi:hypothetical protein
MVLRMRNLFLVILALTLVASACTPRSGTSGTTTVVLPATTAPSQAPSRTTSTATTAPSTVPQLLVAALRDPQFAASVDVTMTQTTGAGLVTFTGVGAVEGGNSRLRLETDYSGLSQPVWDASNGVLVGPGATTKRFQETRLIDDLHYVNSGERWVVELRTDDDDTTVGHVFSRMAAQAWTETASDTINGEELRVLEQTADLEYDPRYFSIDPAVVASARSTTTVYTTEDGSPRLVRINLSMDFGDAAAPGLWTIEYRVGEAQKGAASEHPMDARVSIRDLLSNTDDEPNNGPAQFFNLYVPVAWNVTETGPGYIRFSPTGEDVSILVIDRLFREPTTFSDSFETLLGDLGYVNPTVEPEDPEGIPAAIATTRSPIFGQVYYTLIEGTTGLAVVWWGLTGSVADAQTSLDDVIETLEWIPGGFVVPGVSLGSNLLQRDTRALVLAAEASSLVGCDRSDVVYADVVGGDDTSWREEWVVASCGAFKTYPITFVRASDGGTDIVVSPAYNGTPNGTGS